jgi:hypothetical protein
VKRDFNNETNFIRPYKELIKIIMCLLISSLDIYTNITDLYQVD